MRKINILFILLTLFATGVLSQSIGINADGSAPDGSAMLDISSTEKGLLIPRLDIDDLTTEAPVTSPALGLMAFNTNTTTGIGLYYWDGAAWVRFLSEEDDVSSDDSWKLEGNADTDPNEDFLGTTDNVDLVLRTNNTEKMRLTADGWLGIGTDTPEAFLDLVDNGASIAIQSNAPLIHFNQVDDAKEWYMGVHGENFWIRENCTDVLGNPAVCEERLTILPGGNVGLGVANPTQKLDIDGQVRIRGGAPAAGRVLTAVDADGNAEWQDAPAGGGGGGTLGPVGSQPYQNGRETFNGPTGGGDPGSGTTHTWTVPAGIEQIRVQIAGAGGGSHDDGTSGACGGFVLGEIPVTPGESLTIFVGQGGRGYTNANNPRGGTGSYIARGGTILAGAGGGGGGRRGSTFGNALGGGMNFGLSLNGQNGSTSSGGNGGDNYIGYLWNSIAFIGKNSTGGAINQAGVSARYFTALYEGGNDNNYGFGGNFGGHGRRGVVIVEW